VNISELREKLISEGCRDDCFAILSRGSGNDVYCLDRKGNDWVVFFTERGSDHEPIFASPSESEVCQFFYDHIMGMEHWHIVGFFKEESEAEALEARIRAIGVEPVRNDIPSYSSRNDPRYRVFVVGKDIFTYREHFGNVPMDYS